MNYGSIHEMQKKHFTSQTLSEMLSFFHYTSSQYTEIQNYYTNLIKYNQPPSEKSIVRKPIVNSWIRSKNNNIKPDKALILKRVSDKQIKMLLKDNKILIDSAIPLLTNLSNTLLNQSSGLSLYDKNGINLFVANSALDGMGLGNDLSEESVGTTSHSLCINLEKPVYVLSPENYHPDLRKPKVTFSVPIYDQTDRIIAALTIPYFRDLKYTEMEKSNFLWMLNFLFMLEKNIEQSIMSLTYKPQIRVENVSFDTAMSLVDESVIAVDSTGNISYMNNNGEALLGTPKGNVIGKPYSTILGVIPEIERLLKKKIRNNHITAPYTFVNNDQKYLVKMKSASTPQDEHSVLLCISNVTADSKAPIRDAAGLTHPVDIIWGSSEEMLKAKQITKKVANTLKSILLIGESGTGKELFAHAIHQASRPEGPFVAVNCAALPKGILESELFGYESGAFTGADKNGRIGKIQLAHGGTLFLDEIGDMPLELQAVFLRVLEDKQVMRIGGTESSKVDFRIVAATNRNLQEMIDNKSFREDLYYRIATFEILIPPLRQRKNDILRLAQRFIEEECSPQTVIPQMDDAVKQKLLKYEWPGNVRQLKNTIDYAVSMSIGGKITLDDLPEKITRNKNLPQQAISVKTMAELEREAIEDALLSANNSVKEAAKSLQMSRTTLYRRIKEYGIACIDLD